MCPLAKCGSCVQMDRFIPARSAMDLDVAHYNLLKENCGSGAVSSPCKARPAHAFHALSCLRSPGPEGTTLSVQAEYSKRLAEELGTERPNARILAFKNKVRSLAWLALGLPRPWADRTA